MDLNKKNVKIAGGLVLLGVVSYVALQHLESILSFLKFIIGICSPFIFGGALAFVINLPMRFIEKHLFGRMKERNLKKLEEIRELKVEAGDPLPDEKKLRKKTIMANLAINMARPVSMILAIVLVLGVFGAVIFLVLPSLSDSFSTLIVGIQNAIPQFQNWVREITDNNPQIMEWVSGIEINKEAIINTIQGWAGPTLEFTYNLAIGVSQGLINFFFGLVFALNILIGKERLSVHAKKALYACMTSKNAARVIQVASMVNTAFSRFITGQCLEACILGACFFLLLTVLRFPYAMMISLIIGIMAIIPIVGATLGCILSVLILITVDPMQAVLFVILFLIMQQLESMFIYPNVVGESIGLPAIWVLIAVIVGGDLFGVIGMLIFIPLTSVAYALFCQWANQRLKNKKEAEEKRKLEG